MNKQSINDYITDIETSLSDINRANAVLILWQESMNYESEQQEVNLVSSIIHLLNPAINKLSKVIGVTTV